MIFVVLGTQDKSFERLLKAIDEQIEMKNIKEKVIVQAGSTKYKSKNMKILDLIPIKDFNSYIKKSKYIISHGGVGTILDAIKMKKKVIVVPRLKKYGENQGKSRKTAELMTYGIIEKAKFSDGDITDQEVVIVKRHLDLLKRKNRNVTKILSKLK